MDLSLSLNAKEVLFHLNYMGYRNITKEQLKYFMTDLKKLMKYESNPVESTEIRVQAGPCSINIQRLLEHTVSSKIKQKEKPKEPKDDPKPQQQKHYHPCTQHRSRLGARQNSIPEEVFTAEERPTRVKSAEVPRQPFKTAAERTKPNLGQGCDKKKHQKHGQADKENVPVENAKAQPVKSKMWIRPRSGSHVRKPAKKTDPVSLYQAYQKDWEKFKPNICESSHSELRWAIREKMMGNH